MSDSQSLQLLEINTGARSVTSRHSSSFLRVEGGHESDFSSAGSHLSKMSRKDAAK